MNAYKWINREKLLSHIQVNGAVSDWCEAGLEFVPPKSNLSDLTCMMYPR